MADALGGPSDFAKRSGRKRKQDELRKKRVGLLDQLKRARESGVVARDLSSQALLDDLDDERSASSSSTASQSESESDGIPKGEVGNQPMRFETRDRKCMKYCRNPTGVPNTDRDIRSMLSSSMPLKTYHVDNDPLLDELLNDLDASTKRTVGKTGLANGDQCEFNDCSTRQAKGDYGQRLAEEEQVVLARSSTCKAESLASDEGSVPLDGKEKDECGDISLVNLMEHLNADCDEEWFNCDANQEEEASLQADESEGKAASSLDKCVSDDSLTEALFYWIDAYEDRINHNSGVLYFFGKIALPNSRYQSCCFVVEQVERKILVVSKPNAESLDHLEAVKREFDAVLETFKILKYRWKSREMKNCFFKDVPPVATVLEVCYSASYPELPDNISGETFSRLIGTSNSVLETFLLDKNLKGPGWVKCTGIRRPLALRSWCSAEFVVSADAFNPVEKGDEMPVPPMCVLTLNLCSIPAIKGDFSQILIADVLVKRRVQPDRVVIANQSFDDHFMIIAKRADIQIPFDFNLHLNRQRDVNFVSVVASERALLTVLIAKLHRTDPDVIIGHDLVRTTLEALVTRIDQTKAQFWSKLGRLCRHTLPKSTFNLARICSAGRLLIDTGLSARELLPRCRCFDLSELCTQVLHLVDRKESRHSPSDLISAFSTSNALLSLIRSLALDTRHVFGIAIALTALPLAFQLTTLCGNLLSKTLVGGRSERNEYLLLNAFHQSNYILPDPPTFKQNSTKRGRSVQTSGQNKPQYEGGLVLEPKIGFYDKYILLLDFKSLYPSIIQEYNICFSTIHFLSGEDEKIESFAPLSKPSLSGGSSSNMGVLPAEIQKLVLRRRQIKQMMSDPSVDRELSRQYDIRQMALKLTANSMYGCLGFKNSRFYAEPLAALITRLGRETLASTKAIVENMRCEVIYGDTDSIMVNSCLTDVNQAIKLSQQLKTRINERHSYLEIDLDGLFKSLILLKKKKYAALVVERVNSDKSLGVSVQMKGLDIVRRDWCPLAQEIGESVVNMLLRNSTDNAISAIHALLANVRGRIESGAVDISKFLIDKQLTKSPSAYTDIKSCPHVQVAMRLNKSGQARPGDVISYVICTDGSDNAPTQRGYSPLELASNQTLKIDVKYYLSNQIYPIVSRILEPFPETDSERIAECLGLDKNEFNCKKLKMTSVPGTSVDKREPFIYECPKCKTNQSWDDESMVFLRSGRMHCTLNELCPECRETRPVDHLPYIRNCLVLSIRKCIQKYYQGFVKCDEMTCSNQSRHCYLNGSSLSLNCAACGRAGVTSQYSSSDLYNQLCFFRDMFDVKKSRAYSTAQGACQKGKIELPASTAGCADQMDGLRDFVCTFLRRSAYGYIDLDNLFDANVRPAVDDGFVVLF